MTVCSLIHLCLKSSQVVPIKMWWDWSGIISGRITEVCGPLT